MEKLDLRDEVLIGHSMGTGEVAHYHGRYGSGRVSKAVLISPMPPYLLAADDDPEGIPAWMFDGFIATAQADRPSWLKGFLDNFYNMMSMVAPWSEIRRSKPVSTSPRQAGPSPQLSASRHGRPTFAPTSPASTSRYWSCKGTRTASCRSS
jgi:pimeloyl-ACP methyl ester carboxylesterase